MCVLYWVHPFYTIPSIPTIPTSLNMWNFKGRHPLLEGSQNDDGFGTGSKECCGGRFWWVGLPIDFLGRKVRWPKNTRPKTPSPMVQWKMTHPQHEIAGDVNSIAESGRGETVIFFWDRGPVQGLLRWWQLKYFWNLSPRKLRRWSNLTSTFFKGAETTN